MDLENSIRELKEKRKRVDKAIAALQDLLAADDAAGIQRSRRGRKSMPEAERRQVSERMRKYWRDRRLNKKEEQ